MLGLPYETIEDVKGIAHISEKVVDEYFKVPKDIRKKGLRVTVSAAIFVPKPFTPFQWVAQDREKNVKEKIYALKDEFKSRAINFNYHASKVSFLEAIFARGDRKICDVLIKAFEKGCKFDGWSEYFNYDIWMEAFEECGIDPEFYAYRNREYNELLPWDFIDIGVNKSYLIEENERAKRAEITKDCRQGCTNCGVNKNLGGNCFEGSVLNKIH